MIDEKQLVKVDENGVVVPDPEQVEKLVVMKEAKEQDFKSFESEVKEVILNLMSKYGSAIIKSANYTISRIQPADKVEFNEEKFLLEVPEEILADFVSIIEEKKFNEEKFKAEHPDLYEQYIETNYISSVNVKKLAKSNPTLYDKYTSVTKSDKPATIRIVRTKK